ncbi:protein trichome birefringence-like 2 isoform X1 [Primulina huaijiensis]|uniref:protein trichome birefringence-like 2 isoform X1 n=2 Tax=Primulina huaijiensis TaxID=1492673 RepID=UPI003CC71671
MVGFSSSLPTMDVKKFVLSDQLLSSPRRKVVSRFGFGIVLSFIFFTVVLFMFDISFKTPFFNPVFPGLISFSSHGNNTFVSWPSSSFINTSSESNDSLVVEKSKHICGMKQTFGANVVRSNKSLDFVNSGEKDDVFEDSQAGDVSGRFRDGGFAIGEESVVKKDGENWSLVDKNLILIDSSENVKNESFSAEENDFKDIVEPENAHENLLVHSSGHEPKSDEPKNEALRDGKVRSQTNDGDIDGFKDKVEGMSENARSYKDCDIFSGRWVRDDTKPYYPPDSCPYIDKDFDCHLNGRMDNDFVKWRWLPYDCDIPIFNATDFLEGLRGKRLVFVGDSLNRNMWESLVCMLRHGGVRDTKRVYEISGRREFKKKGFYAFRFEDFNCSVDFVSSPFLVKESSFKGRNGSFETLRLDLMDESTSMYRDADVMVFNTGHWWTHEKTSRGEDYYQEGNYVHPRLKVLEAYKRALTTWANWVDKNIDVNKTRVIFRGYSVTHFRGGPWNLGGQCHNETEPIFNETYLEKYPEKMRVLESVVKDMKTPITYLNISRITDHRKDGHPSVYRPYSRPETGNMHAQDCSHWCLPGVPDTWNELLYVSLLNSGRGSWRN